MISCVAEAVLAAPIPRLEQEEYAWAHEGVYRDLAGAAKQVGNVSVGPWWHMILRDALASLVDDEH